MSLILLVIPCTTTLERPKKVHKDTKSSIELNTGVPVTIHLIWVWRRQTLLNSFDFLLRISWASSNTTRSHCTIWRGVVSVVLRSVYGATVTSAFISIFRLGPSKTLTVRFGAKRSISSTHCVMIDLGKTINVRGFGFPSIVETICTVLPRPISSHRNPPLGPEV